MCPISPLKKSVNEKEVYPFEGETVEQEEEPHEEQNAKLRTRRVEVAPTKAEREEHERSHLPYRGWCETCVRARGVATAHKVRWVLQT